MATATLNGFLQRLKLAMAAESFAPLSDRALLQRFMTSGDEAVFTSLLSRHGPMVFRVCRRVLNREQDAEDAFQATFLVLARQAGAIRKKESLASWLHGVAHRISLEARDRSARRKRHETRAGQEAPATALADDTTWRELRSLLDEELARLPERLRAPLVLCYLEGLTQDEAAKQLAASKSTFRRRLEEGRGVLAKRLARRGVALSAALFAPLLSEALASAALPSKLVGSTATAAARLAAGQVVTPAIVSPRVTALTEGMVQTMSLTKLKAIAVMLFAIAGTITLCAYQTSAQDGKPPPAKPGAAQEAPAAKTSAPVDPRVKSLLDDALQDAADIENAFNRTATFCYIARVHARSGRPDAAKVVLEKALAAEALEQGLVKAQHKDNRLSIIAECQAETGDAKGALETISTGISDLNQTSALSHVSEALAKNGDYKGAMAMIERMQPVRPDDPFKDQALRCLAQAQAATGDVKSALETAERIGDGAGKTLALAAAASALAKKGDREGAAKLVATIRANLPADGIKRDFGLIAVAQAQAAAGQAEDAFKSTQEIADAEWRDGGFWQLAKDQAASGDIPAARQAADAIQDAYQKGEAFKEIVIALIRNKDLAGAIKAAAQIGHDIGRCYGLMEIAKAQAAAGQKAEALQTLQEAQTLADRLENPPRMGNVREAALAHCAGVRAAVGDADGVLDWCKNLSDIHIRAMARIRVAEALAGTARK